MISLWTHQVKTPLTALSLAVKESKLEEKAEYADRLFEIEQYCDIILQYLRMEGGITITMPKSHTICIADTGIGISKEDLPRITERGFTGYNGRMDKKATGIGLFLVDTIMKKLGGSVKITSELGVGTQVYLTLL